MICKYTKQMVENCDGKCGICKTYEDYVEYMEELLEDNKDDNGRIYYE